MITMLLFSFSCSQTTETTDQNQQIEDTAIEESTDFCTANGYPKTEFVEGGDGSFKGIAPDFTIALVSGDWNFRTERIGCDNYVFILDKPDNSDWWPNELWSRDLDRLIEASPLNTHYFFVSSHTGPSSVRASLDELQAYIDQELAGMSEEDRDHWSSRLHLVKDSMYVQEDWIKARLKDDISGFTIGRDQSIRYNGHMGHYERYNSSVGWFEGDLSMAANPAIHENFRAERQTAMDAVDATVVRVWDNEAIATGWGGGHHTATVEIPDLADFDTLELDLFTGCGDEAEYGACPAWDRILTVYACTDEDMAPEDENAPIRCSQELGRWISTYHREGHYVHDVSSLLPMLSSGTRTFSFTSVDAWYITLDLRFSNSEKAEKANELTYLFNGGGFNAGQDEAGNTVDSYNEKYEPQAVNIPADAKKVELVVALSGHGFGGTYNCAEFCNAQHHFYVNGQDNLIDTPEATLQDHCLKDVANGTTPNQGGTWWFGRSNWCPGKEVPLKTVDITDQVQLGELNTFEYAGFDPNGNPHTGGGDHVSIQMNSWVVVHK